MPTPSRRLLQLESLCWALVGFSKKLSLKELWESLERYIERSRHISVKTWSTIVEYLNKNFEENMIIVYSCSFIAKYCIDEVYKIYKTRLTQLDMGASLNPYISFNNRPWMEKIILELNEKNYFVKNKIEYNPYKQTIFE
jgi:hypothetical protein